MTDKQIIIDGVDVAGCEQRFGDNKCALLDQYFCENNPDCYYKQLKAKEQECEALNADNISLRDRVGKLERAILRRNDELDQLKQTLAEIKEIVQFSNRPYKLCGEYNDCCDVLNKIWNKISEVV